MKRTVPPCEPADLDRRVVDVDAGGGRAGVRGDAADRDAGGQAIAAAVELHARSQAGDVVDLPHALAVHAFLGVGGDADRHAAEGLLGPGRGDHDLLEGAFGLGQGRGRHGGHEGDEAGATEQVSGFHWKNPPGEKV
jgi:hypothetical protein